MYTDKQKQREVARMQKRAIRKKKKGYKKLTKDLPSGKKGNIPKGDKY